MQSDCYIEAWKFFEERKVAGLKMPSKKRKSTEGADEEKGNEKDKDAGPSSAKKSKKGAEDVDWSDIHLDGEDKDEVEVRLLHLPKRLPLAS